MTADRIIGRTDDPRMANFKPFTRPSPSHKVNWYEKTAQIVYRPYLVRVIKNDPKNKVLHFVFLRNTDGGDIGNPDNPYHVDLGDPEAVYPYEPSSAPYVDLGNPSTQQLDCGFLFLTDDCIDDLSRPDQSAVPPATTAPIEVPIEDVVGDGKWPRGADGMFTTFSSIRTLISEARQGHVPLDDKLLASIDRILFLSLNNQ